MGVETPISQSRPCILRLQWWKVKSTIQESEGESVLALGRKARNVDRDPLTYLFQAQFERYLEHRSSYLQGRTKASLNGTIH